MTPPRRRAPVVRPDATRVAQPGGDPGSPIGGLLGSVLDHTVKPIMEHPIASGLTALLAGAGGPVGMVARGAFMAPAAKELAEYGGQRAAELSLPRATRPFAEQDPERISGEDAAWDAAPLALGAGASSISEALGRVKPALRPRPRRVELAPRALGPEYQRLNAIRDLRARQDAITRQPSSYSAMRNR